MSHRLVTREALDRGLMEQIIVGADPELVPLTAEDREASLRAILSTRDGAGDIWVFAYGSLIWNPALVTIDRRPARIFGFHRRLCLLTRVARGTPESPGLLFGLDRGGSCRGIALRIAAPDAWSELSALWRREMVDDAYRPIWVTAHDSGGAQLRCVTFAMNRRHRRYAGRLDADHIAAIVAAACGRLGPCSAYVREAAASFAAERISDPLLSSVVRRLEGGDGLPGGAALCR